MSSIIKTVLGVAYIECRFEFKG